SVHILTTLPQADGVSDKDFYLKAVASVTLDPNGKYFLCQQTLSRQNEFLPVAPTASSHGV
ncbi:MAG: hypothetical protein IID17_12985, partial [Nitrospinae bacterium]|nr:hypothetical protein [Nitrospinota bacterium]